MTVRGGTVQKDKMRWLLFLPAAVLVLQLLAVPQAKAGALALPAGVPVGSGPLGPFEVQGMLSGLAISQNNAIAGDRGQRFDVDNAQLILQKNSGAWQFMVQGGAYTFPTLGVPFTDTPDVASNLYGPVPVAYLKYAVSDNVSVQAGKFSTLLGAESAWPWGNFNVERGLLWNLENTITRGVQLNYARGAVSASLAWTDGFYSNRFNNLTGLFSYSMDSSDTLSVVVYDTLRPTPYDSTATPQALNNARIYDLIYTHTAGNWTLTPYLQYDFSPASSKLSYAHDNSSTGVALLADYAISRAWNFGARVEYATSSDAGNGSSNNNLLGYGPGSHAWTLTLTTTWQSGGPFVRSEVSYVHVWDYTMGFAFGIIGDRANQTRVMLESGLVF